MMGTKILAIFACIVAVVSAGDKYTDKYDNINLKEIIENDRLFEAYFDCVMDKGKCTPEGKELKEHLQDAIETGCEKCTKPQEDGMYTVIEHLITHKREMWDALCAKYDPTGKWRKVYEEKAKAKGIEIPKD